MPNLKKISLKVYIIYYNTGRKQSVSSNLYCFFSCGDQQYKRLDDTEYVVNSEIVCKMQNQFSSISV